MFIVPSQLQRKGNVSLLGKPTLNAHKPVVNTLWKSLQGTFTQKLLADLLVVFAQASPLLSPDCVFEVFITLSPLSSQPGGVLFLKNISAHLQVLAHPQVLVYGSCPKQCVF